MVYINEWLPNPTGSDTEGEWVELYNEGQSAVRLAGWRLANEKGKAFYFSNHTIGPEEFLLLRRAETKLVLRNEGGGLFLYDERGELVDKASFIGAAPEGKSMGYNFALNKTSFSSKPTPGTANIFLSTFELVDNKYPRGAPLNASALSTYEFLGLLFGSSLLIALLVLYAARHNNALSHVLFKKD